MSASRVSRAPAERPGKRTAARKRARETVLGTESSIWDTLHRFTASTFHLRHPSLALSGSSRAHVIQTSRPVTGRDGGRSGRRRWPPCEPAERGPVAENEATGRGQKAAPREEEKRSIYYGSENTNSGSWSRTCGCKRRQCNARLTP